VWCKKVNFDQLYMARALRLAERGRYSTQPNPRVGCVIVKNGEIVGEGFHQTAGEAHAEIIALTQAGPLARGAEVFITLEPCSHHGRTPPCAEALIKARPSRVIIAMKDPNPLVSGQGIEKLQAQGINVRCGVCDAEARQLNRGFIQRMQTGRPFVTLKLATSLDGRVAMQNGESAWITSPAARRDVHRLRLENCAIVTGINTVLTDNPRMTVRLSSDDIPQVYFLGKRHPACVVLDSENRLGRDAAIWQSPGETWQLVSQQANHNAPDGNVIAMPVTDEGLDLNAVLHYLGAQQMNNVLVEAGGTLAAAFIKAGLIDELVVYQSPDIMGASAQAMINLPEILKMSEKIEFEYQDLRKIGRDLKLTLVQVPPSSEY
jgi:diaminohydroxyphosphoribosylaminopyrimidine deaminase/5-amino-6-(5-phosphoribosylamino)uracil reductase